MLTPGNVVKVYKKEVLNNLVSGWNKVGFLSCNVFCLVQYSIPDV